MEFEPSVYCSVQQLWMVRCGHRNDVTRQVIDEQEQRAHHALDFPGLVFVSAFLCDCVELVKEKDAVSGAGELEHLSESCPRLAQVAPHNRLIANAHEWHAQGFGDGLGETRLAVTRRTGNQESVARFESVRSQELDSLLLFNKLIHGLPDP